MSVKVVYCSILHLSLNSNHKFKHFTAEGAEELRDREVQSLNHSLAQSLNPAPSTGFLCILSRHRGRENRDPVREEA